MYQVLRRLRLPCFIALGHGFVTSMWLVCALCRRRVLADSRVRKDVAVHRLRLVVGRPPWFELYEVLIPCNQKKCSSSSLANLCLEAHAFGSHLAKTRT